MNCADCDELVVIELMLGGTQTVTVAVRLSAMPQPVARTQYSLLAAGATVTAFPTPPMIGFETSPARPTCHWYDSRAPIALTESVTDWPLLIETLCDSAVIVGLQTLTVIVDVCETQLS